MFKPVEGPEIIRTVKEVFAEGEQGRPSGSSSVPLDEPVFLNLYNERLVRKLKRTIHENEQARLFLGHIMEGMGDGASSLAGTKRFLMPTRRPLLYSVWKSRI
jgi:hypothetical protein